MNDIKINNKGQALVVVMLLGIVLLILVMSITTSVSKTTNQSSIDYGSQVSFANAQSGIQQAQSAINSGNPSGGNCSHSTTTNTCSYNTSQVLLSNSSATKPITAKVPKSVTLPISIDNISSYLNLTFNISDSSKVKIYYVNNSNATLYSCYFNVNRGENYTLSIPKGTTVIYLELNSSEIVSYYEGTGGISIPSSSCN